MKTNKFVSKQILMMFLVIFLSGNMSINVFANNTSYINLTGKWTYVDNMTDNPPPVLVDQGNNTWILAMYQGTIVSLEETNATYLDYWFLHTDSNNNNVTITPTFGDIIVEAVSVGVSANILHFEEIIEDEEIKGTEKQIILIVNVVPAQPNARSGIWTNDENNKNIPDYVINKKFQQVTSEIFNESMSDYQKVKAAWDWMIVNLTYDSNTAYRKNKKNTEEGKNLIYGISPYRTGGIIDGLVVCDGYAHIFNEFMKYAGIESRRIEGQDHAWNQVKLDGQWYNLDVTWGDEDDEFYAGEADYDYFLVSSHTLEDKTFDDAHKPKFKYDIECMEEATTDYPVDHDVLVRENAMKDPNYRYNPEEDCFELIEGSPLDLYYDDLWDDFDWDWLDE